MPTRSRSDIPRLSGRPGPAAGDPPQRDATGVFRRFFDLLERLEKPGSPHAPPAAKTGRAAGREARR